tara:strand:+ start:109 stop:378 length:270 start_codon:yes stop_codon:yes gene_type:complete
MKVKLELFGASRDFSHKKFIEFNLKEKSSIRDLRKEIINFIEKNFSGNASFNKIVETSAFCSEDNEIIGDSYKIKKPQKIGIIPPIGGG